MIPFLKELVFYRRDRYVHSYVRTEVEEETCFGDPKGGGTNSKERWGKAFLGRVSIWASVKMNGDMGSI